MTLVQPPHRRLTTAEAARAAVREKRAGVDPSERMTPRRIARAQNVERIKELALAQLAASSASELSLRSIARELNLVSSAIYRYFAGRDELITALILDGYADLADTLEAVAGRRSPRRIWLERCHRLRGWALDQPHRFALIYGSAIPGYQAPAETIEPAGRVLLAFCGPAVDGAHDGAHDGRGRRLSGVPRGLTGQLATMRTGLGLELSDPQALNVCGAFARVIGLLTLELNGHLVGSFEPADQLFTALVEREADLLWP